MTSSAEAEESRTRAEMQRLFDFLIERLTVELGQKPGPTRQAEIEQKIKLATQWMSDFARSMEFYQSFDPLFACLRYTTASMISLLAAPYAAHPDFPKEVEFE